MFENNRVVHILVMFVAVGFVYVILFKLIELDTYRVHLNRLESIRMIKAIGPQNTGFHSGKGLLWPRH